MVEAITRDPDVMHGTPVFRGTPVPVRTRFDYLEKGESLDNFLERDGSPCPRHGLGGRPGTDGAQVGEATQRYAMVAPKKLAAAVEMLQQAWHPATQGRQHDGKSKTGS